MGSRGAPGRQSYRETGPLGMTVLPWGWPSPSAPSKLVWPGRGQTLQADLSSKQLPALSSSPGGRRSSLKLADETARVHSLWGWGPMPGRPTPSQLLNRLRVETAGMGDPFCVCLRPLVKPQFRLSTKPESHGAQSQTGSVPSVQLMLTLSVSL